MTTPDLPQVPDAKVRPETLELRARPQPVTRINRKVLIGGAAVLLLIISGIVLVALKPAEPAHNQSPGALQCRPQAHHGWAVQAAGHLRRHAARQEADAGKAPAVLAPGVPQLTEPTPREAPATELRPDPIPRPSPIAADGDLTILLALRAAERARAIAAGDLDGLVADDTSDQTRKLSFLKSGPEKEIYNPHGLQKPASPYQLMAGTIIAASMVSGLNSDLPGFVIAQVTENVYDTVSGRFLLIPQGSRLVGKYDNVIAFGQERALVVWQRIILPGTSIVIDNLPATDTGGYAGLADQVDLHTWKLLKGVALATVLGVGSQLAFGSSDSDLVKALQQSTQSTTNRAGQRLVERNLNVQPTITVRPGWPLRVIVHKDIVLRPYRGPSSP